MDEEIIPGFAPHEFEDPMPKSAPRADTEDDEDFEHWIGAIRQRAQSPAI